VLGGGGAAPVLSADVAPDGRLLLAGDADGVARLWDLGARAAVGAVQDAHGALWAARWRPGGAAFATSAEDGVVRFYRAAGTGTEWYVCFRFQAMGVC
jgi:WD40 repeat protein